MHEGQIRLILEVALTAGADPPNIGTPPPELDMSQSLAPMRPTSRTDLKLVTDRSSAGFI